MKSLYKLHEALQRCLVLTLENGYEAPPCSAPVALSGANAWLSATITFQASTVSLDVRRCCAPGWLSSGIFRRSFVSRVTALELSADGTGLYSGCGAASPKRNPDAVDVAPVKLLAAQVRMPQPRVGSLLTAP